ncbi:MAG: hypothetical protein VB029_07075 [Anaerolineaceae bacterium]|nr:hypothetical protein [Anaerolineaceae bacterium]
MQLPFWTVQPPKGLLKGDYYHIEERFPPYYKGVEGQFPSDPGHLGIFEVVKANGTMIFIELNEITAPSYYNHLYCGISKRRSDYSMWQYTKDRMKQAGVVLTLGFEHVEKQMLEQQRIRGDFDLLASASGSVKKILKLAEKVETQISQPSEETLYSYSEEYGYGLTGWLKVVVQDKKIVSCRFDEIFADNPEDIMHPELKKYYRQSKYDCPTYEDPFPPTWDRHAFLVGFRTQMDNLNLKVVATQDMLDLSGLPHSEGEDLGPLWNTSTAQKKDLDMKVRPCYPVWTNYLRMAKVVLEEMKKDGAV